MKNAVRELRDFRGLSQANLAEALGASGQTINSIENDRYKPSLPWALAIGRFFDQRVEEVLDAPSACRSL